MTPACLPRCLYPARTTALVVPRPARSVPARAPVSRGGWAFWITMVPTRCISSLIWDRSEPAARRRRFSCVIPSTITVVPWWREDPGWAPTTTPPHSKQGGGGGYRVRPAGRGGGGGGGATTGGGPTGQQGRLAVDLESKIKLERAAGGGGGFAADGGFRADSERPGEVRLRGRGGGVAVRGDGVGHTGAAGVIPHVAPERGLRGGLDRGATQKKLPRAAGGSVFEGDYIRVRGLVFDGPGDDIRGLVGARRAEREDRAAVAFDTG